MFVVTGTGFDCLRIKAIVAEDPDVSSVWRGTLWELVNGKRKCVCFIKGGELIEGA